jgi:PAS domain S-box-containing protein
MLRVGDSVIETDAWGTPENPRCPPLNLASGVPLAIIKFLLIIGLTWGPIGVNRWIVSMPNNTKILVVDDNEANRYALAHCLRQAGYETIEAATAADCLRLVREAGPALILLDVKLPDQNGTEVCRMLKAAPATANLPIIQISAVFTHANHRIAGLETGADAYLPAPFESRELLAHIKALLRIRESESALRKSEERFRILFEQNPDPFFSVDLQGRFLLANRACEEVSGYAIAELIGMNFLSLCAPDQREHTTKAFRRGFQEQVAQRIETALIRKGGGRVELLITGSPFVVDGQLTELNCTAKDITERKRGEEALRRAEERYRMLFEATRDGVVLHPFSLDSGECRFLEANKAACELLGYSLHELLGLSPIEIQAPEERLAVGHEADMLQRQGRLLFDKVLIRKDGTRFSAEIHSSLFYRDGRPYSVSSIRDVTERKRADVALRQSEEAYRRLIETAHEGIWRIDAEGRTTYVNQRMADLLGYTPAEIMGRLHTEFMWEEDRPKGDTDLELRRQGSRAVWDQRYRRKDGSELWTVASCNAIYDANGSFGGALGMFSDITDRKRAEEALWQAHQRLQKTIDSITDGLLVLDREWRYTYFSEQAARIIRVRREDVIGRVVWELFPQAKGTKFYELYHRAVQTGEPQHFEEFYPEPMNQWLECHCYPSDEGLTVYFHDVTDRKRAEERAAELQGKLKAALLAGEVGTFEWNVLENRMWGDPNFARIFGSTSADSGNARPLQEYMDAIHPDDRAHVTELVNRTVMTGCAYEAEYRIVTGGRTRWVVARGTGERDEAGRIIRFPGVVLDITLLKEVEHALRRSEQRLRVFFESDMAGALYWKMDGQITEANDRFLGMVGFSRQDLKAGLLNWAQMTPPEFHHLDERALAELWETGVETPYEKEFIRKDGTRVPVIVGAAMMKGEDHEGVAFVLDITDRKSAELALRQAQQQLRQHAAILEQTVSERTARLRETVADLEQFSYSLAHDLRAPLRSMNCFSAFLMEELGPKLQGQCLEYVKRIASGAERMDQLICDVLTYTKVARIEITPAQVNLDALVTDIIQQYPNLHPEQADIQVNGPLLPVLGNHALLTQCLSNLLGNAVKFVSPSVRPKIRIWTEPLGDRVRVLVSDNGIGIRHNKFEQIWRIFQRGHPGNEYPGTGIGLSVVKRAAERMGGTVGVSSDPGKGSTFWFELPKA